jgi:hypothetical protein
MIFHFTNCHWYFYYKFSNFVSSALRAMCATFIHPSIKGLLIFKCQIILFYLRVYALGCLVFSYFLIYICIVRLWHLQATVNTSFKLRRWEICQIYEGNDRAHRRTRTNEPRSHAVNCIMCLRQHGYCILLVSLFNSCFSNLLHFNSWHFSQIDNELNSTNKRGCEDNVLVITQIYWFTFPRHINYNLIAMSEDVWSLFWLMFYYMSLLQLFQTTIK